MWHFTSSCLETTATQTVQESICRSRKIIERLKREFAFVTVNEQAGRRSTEETINRREQMAAEGKNPWGWPVESQVAYYESIKHDTRAVLIADSANYGNAHLSTLLIPDNDIVFGYSSRAHFEGARELVLRAANAIGYEIEEG